MAVCDLLWLAVLAGYGWLWLVGCAWLRLAVVRQWLWLAVADVGAGSGWLWLAVASVVVGCG